MPELFPERDAFYQQGLQAFHAAQWQQAVDAFTAFQRSGGDPSEVDGLLANAQLKLEIERMHLASPPLVQPQRRRAVPIIIVLFALALLGAGAALLVMRGQTPQNTVALAQTTVLSVTPSANAEATMAPTGAALLAPTTEGTSATNGVLQVAWNNASIANRRQRIEIILDASGSMLGRVKGQRKIEIAHEALTTLISQLPADAEVALRTYGRHRSDDCQDVELVQPFGKLDRAGLIAQVTSIVPVPEARTPLALSLEQTANDLRDADGDVMVIVVSDGDETCNGDPAFVAEQLHTARSQLRVSVIGFSVGPEEWRKRLQAIAARGGGNYFNAVNTSELVVALQKAVSDTVTIQAVGSDQTIRGQIGQAIDLPPGSYSITVDGLDNRVQDIEVVAGQTTMLQIQEQAGMLLAAQAEPVDPK